HLIFQNVEKAYRNGDDMRARKEMLYASFLAGDAFSKSYVGYVHAVSHALSAAYNSPHGLTNAVLLPYFLDAYGPVIAGKLQTLALAAGVADRRDSPGAAAQKFIKAVRELNRRMGIPETIPGIKEKDIPYLARHAAKEANPLYPVPVLWNARELERFFYMVME
nr:iron-containing alcohol dehydrogenase [Lachnospiraceae bacterium]